MRKYYEMLGVKNDVGPSDLRDATRRVLGNTNGGNGHEGLKEICEAYLVISNSDEKTKYDAITDEEYFSASNNRVKALAEKLALSIEDQKWRLIKNYGKTLDQYWFSVLKNGGIFLVSALVAFASHAAQFGYIIFLFPVAALVGFVTALDSLKRYFDYKKGQKRFLRQDVWSYIEFK